MNKIYAFILALVVPLNVSSEELFIYNWSDYIAEDTISNFEAETGIKVTYDMYDSNEVLEAKLLAGNSGYDLVFPSGSFMENQINAGVYQKIDKSLLTNIGNLDPVILEKVDAHDPGSEYSVVYMYGTTGIGYNEDEVEARGGNVDSWDIILNPDEVSKFADCGVAILDAPSEVVEIALNYLGYDPNTESTKANNEALELLKQIRPYVKYFDSSQYIDDLANGEICLAMGWSGDVFYAADTAADDVSLWYSVPSEGTVIWFDMMGIPADAKNVENAHKFIDYILRPEVVAEITNYVWYSNPNLVANNSGLIDEEILEDPAIYPTDDVLEILFGDTADSPQKSRISSRIFNSFKASQ
jgi:putrescine transport system substrate-binding protein|tara:strand:+ start:255 stop:1322 length:1068 start_codon:yes stop_codon:yes gene_type:complete